MNAFEYAIQMEVDGEMYYRELALENKDNDLKQVFISLAEDEKNHAKIIKEKQMGTSYLVDKEDMASDKNVFSEATGVVSEDYPIEQLNAYRKALEMEKKSINLYKKLLSETEAKEEKDIFEFLIEQEEDHYNIIEEIIEMVMRPQEWIESAEFRLRKTY